MKRIIVFIFIMVIFNLPFLCFGGSNAKKEVKEGNLLYNEGKFDDALKKYEEAFLGNPDSDIVNFNLGTALYKTDDYEKSLEHFKRSLLTEDQSLEQKANYNLGNCEYKFGISKEDFDLKDAVKLLEESLRHYGNVLDLDSKDQDAKYNHEFVEKELKRLKEKLEQQTQEQQNNQDKEKNDQNSNKSKNKNQKSKDSQSDQKENSEDSKQKDVEENKQDEQAMNQGQGEEEKTKSGSQEESQLSEEQARMLLEGYAQDEEPKSLYQKKLPKGLEKEVLKDW